MEREDVFQDDPSPRSPLALSQGTVLNDQFEIGRILGVGGFGITYLAFDKVLEMVVAVKEYLPSNIAVRKTGSQSVQPVSSGGNARDFEFGLERFLQEARTLAKFEDHPNIVRVRTFFEENGTGYFVMNFYEGRTLAEYLAAQNGHIPEEEALLIMDQVFDGLSAVHEADILHRDIDPNNVYLGDNGRVVLLDFGAARAAVTEQTQSLSVVLKRGYAPHEQYHSRGNQGPWTDVYACSATLYYALTGYKPPEAASRMLQDDLAPPQTLAPSISDPTNDAILKGLSIQPDHRPQSIASFRSLLPAPPEDAEPDWVGDVTTTDFPSRDKGAELQVTTTHACRLYVDGSQVGELSPLETYAIGTEPGTHHLRAVRFNQDASSPATITATSTGTSGRNGGFASLDDVIWKKVVSTSPDDTSSIEIDFDSSLVDSEPTVEPDSTDASTDPPSGEETTGGDVSQDEKTAHMPSEEQSASPSDSTPPPDDTATEMETEELLSEFADEAPGFISASVVEIDRRIGVASHTRDPDFDVSGVNRAYTDFVESNRNALNILGADPLDTTDILVSANDTYYLVRELNADYYLGLAISQNANLALARQLMETYEPKLLDALPDSSNVAS